MIDAIILAAGNSTRFRGNKLLYPINRKPIYRHLLETIYEAKKARLLNHVIVVTQYHEIFSDIDTNFPRLQAVANPAPERGISSSIRIGLEQLAQISPQSQGCLFAVADQPGLTLESVEKLIQYWRRHDCGIAAASHNKESKNPVIFSSNYYEELKTLKGDQGGKKILHRHMDDVGLCQIPAAELEDIDTPEDINTPQPAAQITESDFPFIKDQKHVISIVGAGGKTTLMYTLAHWYTSHGKKVIITTTTHIKKPAAFPTADNKEQLQNLLKHHSVIAAGTDAPEGKLIWPRNTKLTDLQTIADILLIEADGARHLPCKVPAQTEPVIPKQSDIVLGVMGIDALGGRLEDICFRKEKAMELLRTHSSHIMTEKDLAEILSSPQGTRKNTENKDYYVILNKCDDREQIKQAEEIKNILKKKGIPNVIITSLQKIPTPFDI